MRKKKLCDIGFCLSLILIVGVSTLLNVCVIARSVHKARMITVVDEIQRGAVTTQVIKLNYANLSVQPKEEILYPVHEYTPEELAEQEYDDSLELLAICVEAEAGNQDLMGKRLVVDVILNRVDSDDFPNNITDVITQPYQFTSYSDGHMDAVWSPSEETYEAVRMELENRTNSEVLFFTEGRYNPYCEEGFIYGAHYFGY